MATKQSSNAWQTARWHSGVVPIADGAREIYATVAGQRRLPQPDGKLQPLVIIEAGLDAVQEEHVVVAQMVASFGRVLRYNRAGYGQSTFRDGVPDYYSAADIAQDLSMLLTATDLSPPYILVGHSYGTTLCREFLEQRPNDVVGMVLVDGLPLFQDMDNMEQMMGVLLGDSGGEDLFSEVIGLEQNKVLTPEQEEQRIVATEIGEKNGTFEAHRKACFDSQATVNKSQGIKTETDETGFVVNLTFTKKSMAGRISVILGDFELDFQKVLDYGKSKGHGDEALYKKAAAFLDLNRRVNHSSQIAMAAVTTGESRVVKATGTGRTHNMQITRPDIIADEIRWVMEGAWDLKNY